MCATSTKYEECAAPSRACGAGATLCGTAGDGCLVLRGRGESLRLATYDWFKFVCAHPRRGCALRCAVYVVCFFVRC